MRVAALRTLGFRNLAPARAGPRRGDHPAVGAERRRQDERCSRRICLALSGRSCRTRNEREAIAFGEPLARIEAEVTDGGETHVVPLVAGSVRGAPPPGRRQPRDGGARRAAAAAGDLPARPPGAGQGPARPAPRASGPPRAPRCGRRAPRLGAATAGRSPSGTRCLGRIRSGAAPVDSLAAWERELAAAGVELIASRREAVDLLAPGFAEAAAELCLPGAAELRYLPRTEAADPEAAGRRASRAPRARIWRAATRPTARTWTSWRSRSTDARCAATARRASSARRCWRCCSPSAAPCSRRAEAPPLMLLDDVMSELDARPASPARRRGSPRAAARRC